MKQLPNRFTTVEFTKDEEEMATNVGPYFFAYLNNKIADYASAIVAFTYEDMGDSKSMQDAIIRHEVLKGQVEVLEELMRELNVPEADEISARQS